VPEKPDIMTTKEVAALYRFEVETVRRWVRMGRLRALRVGSQMRFRRKDVVNAMERFEYGEDQPKHDPSMG